MISIQNFGKHLSHWMRCYNGLRRRSIRRVCFYTTKILSKSKQMSIPSLTSHSPFKLFFTKLARGVLSIGPQRCAIALRSNNSHETSNRPSQLTPPCYSHPTATTSPLLVVHSRRLAASIRSSILTPHPSVLSNLRRAVSIQPTAYHLDPSFANSALQSPSELL